MARVIRNEVAYEAAICNNIRINAQKTFFRTHEDADTIINTVESGAKRGNEFFMSLYAGYQKYGRLTEGQVAAVRRYIAKAAERKAEWAAKNAEKNAALVHVGEVGKRVELTLTCKKVIEYVRKAYHYCDSGIGYICIAEDANGNVVVYRGNSGFPAEGRTAIVKCTVKEHVVYNGTKQTIVSRPTIVAMK